MSFKTEEEIRPKNIFKELLECCRIDAENLLKSGEFSKISCPGCESEQISSSFIKSGFIFNRCSNCDSLYNSPRPTKQSLDKFYPTSKSSEFFFKSFYPQVEEARKKKVIPERIKIVQSFLDDQNEELTILDVGAGQGFFFDLMREIKPDYVYKVIEPNPLLAEVCRNKGYEVVEDFVENTEMWAGQIDFLLCFEVFEHVHNPFVFIEKLKSFLAPSGTLLITTLSGSGLDISYLNDKADIVAPPQHLNFLSIKGFKELFTRIGFRKIEIVTPGKLDVNIIKNKLSEEESSDIDFFGNFIRNISDETSAKLQEVIADNKLSSHIWVIAS